VTHLHQALEVALSVRPTSIRLIGLLELSDLTVHFLKRALLDGASEMKVYYFGLAVELRGAPVLFLDVDRVVGFRGLRGVGVLFF